MRVLITTSLCFIRFTLVLLVPLDIQDDGVVLSNDDFDRAQNLTEKDLYNNRKGSRSWIQNSYFNGDIKGKAAKSTTAKQQRNGVRLAYDKWPNNKIPYVISTRYLPGERAILARAIQSYHERTCIQFVGRTTERDYLYIGKIDGCFSDVGRAGGRQEVSLDDGCLEYDTAIHELMHAVGFWHEHERWDRDDYISILWQNIEKDAYDQFGKVNLFESDYYGEAYDYYSIMHYDAKAFSKNNQNTIETRLNGLTPTIGHVKDFSATDLRKINKMYNCQAFLPPGFNNGGNSNFGNTPSITAPVVITQPFAPAPTVPFAQPFVPATFPTANPFPVVPNPIQPTEESKLKCKDKATLCWRWTSRCRSPFFDQVMREFCSATCGFCDANSAVNPGDIWTNFYRNDNVNGKR